uniref:Uncharacterized protein n=1 Tax=Parascaris univalens TaxID=6257 RepID=A0A915C8M9_PARUN
MWCNYLKKVFEGMKMLYFVSALKFLVDTSLTQSRIQKFPSKYSFSLWMCTCSLAISIGAATLLPFSVIGSEILQAYPDSYYFQWLNWPLIHSLWNYVFALSNLSLFVLLPFAYFFIESQGFRGQGKGIMARVYETVAVCIMLIVVLICLADVVQSFLLFQQKSISLSLLSFTSVDLPFIYSCVSLIGVFTLLITTPIG